jgi:hypothetical protein
VNNQSGGVNIPGNVGTVFGSIVGRDQIIILVNPIGKIIDAVPPPGPNVYVDRRYKFSINWPNNSDWIPSSRMGEYQLSELGLSWSKETSFFFGLAKTKFPATNFAVCKFQRPQGVCVGYVIIDIYTNSFKLMGISWSYGVSLSLFAKVIAADTMWHVRNAGGEIISQNVGSWDGNSWRWSEASTPVIIHRDKISGAQFIVKIIRGDDHIYSVSSSIYPPTSAYDNLRAETNAILNSFKLL